MVFDKNFKIIYYSIIMILTLLCINFIMKEIEKTNATTLTIRVYTQDTSGNYKNNASGINNIKIYIFYDIMKTTRESFNSSSYTIDYPNLGICTIVESGTSIKPGFKLASGLSIYQDGLMNNPDIKISRNKYNANFYTVIDGNANLLKTQEYYYEATISFPSAPSYSGYVFDGWYTTKDGGGRTGLHLEKCH